MYAINELMVLPEKTIETFDTIDARYQNGTLNEQMHTQARYEGLMVAMMTRAQDLGIDHEEVMLGMYRGLAYIMSAIGVEEIEDVHGMKMVKVNHEQTGND